MTTMEITLLLIGLVAFVASFILTPNTDNQTQDVISIEELRDLSEQEYENLRTRIQNLADETCDYSLEKAERNLERLTNEKITALGEYSDTIISQIGTNHQETVFLHDMLSQNKNELQILLSQAVKDSKEASEASKEALTNANTALEESRAAVHITNEAIMNASVAEEQLLKVKKEKLEAEISSEPKKTRRTTAKTSTKTTAKTTSKAPRKKKEAEPSADEILIDTDGQISLNFDMDESAAGNNEKVLALHKAGKSNVAIAKELDLGVGEVKLIIDLFEKK